MTWFKVDDRSHHNPKVLAAGNEAWGAFCRAGAWASENLTDGLIPEAAAHSIAKRKIWKKLLECELVVESQRGYEIPKFLEYNPCATEVLERKAEVSRKRAEQGRLGGLQSGETRRSKRSKTEANDEAKPKQTTKQTGSPDPDPIEDPVFSGSLDRDPKDPTPMSDWGQGTPMPTGGAVSEDCRGGTLADVDCRAVDGPTAEGPRQPRPQWRPEAQQALQLEPVPERVRTPAEQVFGHWQAKMVEFNQGKGPSPKFSDKRKRKVKDRLRDNHTVADLKRAIDGYFTSPHHRGENDRNTVYLDLELICRDTEHVEAGFGLASRSALPRATPPPSRNGIPFFGQKPERREAPLEERPRAAVEAFDELIPNEPEGNYEDE